MSEESDMTFSEVAAEMDRLILSKNYTDLKVYLEQLKNGLHLYTQSECFPLYYYMGTGYDALADHYRDISEDKDVALEFRKWSFFYLREVIGHYEQEDSNSILLMCAYTNYANGLDSCGRVIEALRIYRKALTLNPKFGMALGNYGRALNFMQIWSMIQVIITSTFLSI